MKAITPLLERPILVAGLGLTASAWAIQSLHPLPLDWGGPIVWGTIAVGSGIWWLKGRLRTPEVLMPEIVDRSLVDRSLAATQTQIDQLAAELATQLQVDDSAVADLRQQLAHLHTQLERSTLRLAIMGSKSAGKTTLTQLLQPHTASKVAQAQEGAQLTGDHNADLVLFVTTGDLTQPEYDAIQTVLTRQQRLLLVFNKQDRYLPSERPLILQQLRDRMQGQLDSEDVVMIAAQPVTLKVRQQQADGTLVEKIEQPEPDLAGLTDRMNRVIQQEGRHLVYKTVLRQTYQLQTQIKQRLNAIRRDRAVPAIEQYQWIAAATAFANPVPSLDLLATAAINTQLIVDLSALYQQPFSLQQAKAVAGILASQMVKLGLVEVTTQTVTGLLKTNAITYVAGGAIQGISAAYLTRLAGLTLVEYFEEQAASSAPVQTDRLIQKLKGVFQDNQRTAFLQTLVKQGMQRLVPNPTSTLPSAS